MPSNPFTHDNIPVTNVLEQNPFTNPQSRVNTYEAPDLSSLQNQIDQQASMMDALNTPVNRGGVEQRSLSDTLNALPPIQQNPSTTTVQYIDPNTVIGDLIKNPDFVKGYTALSQKGQRATLQKIADDLAPNSQYSADQIYGVLVTHTKRNIAGDKASRATIADDEGVTGAIRNTGVGLGIVGLELAKVLPSFGNVVQHGVGGIVGSVTALVDKPVALIAGRESIGWNDSMNYYANLLGSAHTKKSIDAIDKIIDRQNRSTVLTDYRRELYLQERELAGQDFSVQKDWYMSNPSYTINSLTPMIVSSIGGFGGARKLVAGAESLANVATNAIKGRALRTAVDNPSMVSTLGLQASAMSIGDMQNETGRMTVDQRIATGAIFLGSGLLGAGMAKVGGSWEANLLNQRGGTAKWLSGSTIGRVAQGVGAGAINESITEGYESTVQSSLGDNGTFSADHIQSAKGDILTASWLGGMIGGTLGGVTGGISRPKRTLDSILNDAVEQTQTQTQESVITQATVKNTTQGYGTALFNSAQSEIRNAPQEVQSVIGEIIQLLDRGQLNDQMQRYVNEQLDIAETYLEGGRNIIDDQGGTTVGEYNTLLSTLDDLRNNYTKHTQQTEPTQQTQSNITTTTQIEDVGRYHESTHVNGFAVPSSLEGALLYEADTGAYILTQNNIGRSRATPERFNAGLPDFNVVTDYKTGDSINVNNTEYTVVKANPLYTVDHRGQREHIGSRYMVQDTDGQLIPINHILGDANSFTIDRGSITSTMDHRESSSPIVRTEVRRNRPTPQEPIVDSPLQTLSDPRQPSDLVGQQVNYGNHTGILQRSDDGIFFIDSVQTGERIYIESAESGATAQELGLQAINDRAIFSRSLSDTVGATPSLMDLLTDPQYLHEPPRVTLDNAQMTDLEAQLEQHTADRDQAVRDKIAKEVADREAQFKETKELWESIGFDPETNQINFLAVVRPTQFSRASHIRRVNHALISKNEQKLIDVLYDIASPKRGNEDQDIETARNILMGLSDYTDRVTEQDLDAMGIHISQDLILEAVNDAEGLPTVYTAPTSILIERSLNLDVDEHMQFILDGDFSIEKILSLDQNIANALIVELSQFPLDPIMQRAVILADLTRTKQEPYQSALLRVRGMLLANPTVSDMDKNTLRYDRASITVAQRLDETLYLLNESQAEAIETLKNNKHNKMLEGMVTSHQAYDTFFRHTDESLMKVALDDLPDLMRHLSVPRTHELTPLDLQDLLLDHGLRSTFLMTPSTWASSRTRKQLSTIENDQQMFDFLHDVRDAGMNKQPNTPMARDAIMASAVLEVFVSLNNGIALDTLSFTRVQVAGKVRTGVRMPRTQPVHDLFTELAIQSVNVLPPDTPPVSVAQHMQDALDHLIADEVDAQRSAEKIEAAVINAVNLSRGIYTEPELVTQDKTGATPRRHTRDRSAMDQEILNEHAQDIHRAVISVAEFDRLVGQVAQLDAQRSKLEYDIAVAREEAFYNSNKAKTASILEVKLDKLKATQSQLRKQVDDALVDRGTQTETVQENALTAPESVASTSAINPLVDAVVKNIKSNRVRGIEPDAPFDLVTPSHLDAMQGYTHQDMITDYLASVPLEQQSQMDTARVIELTEQSIHYDNSATIKRLNHTLGTQVTTTKPRLNDAQQTVLDLVNEPTTQIIRDRAINWDSDAVNVMDTPIENVIKNLSAYQGATGIPVLNAFEKYVNGDDASFMSIHDFNDDVFTRATPLWKYDPNEQGFYRADDVQKVVLEVMAREKYKGATDDTVTQDYQTAEMIFNTINLGRVHRAKLRGLSDPDIQNIVNANTIPQADAFTGGFHHELAQYLEARDLTGALRWITQQTTAQSTTVQMAMALLDLAPRFSHGLVINIQSNSTQVGAEFDWNNFAITFNGGTHANPYTVMHEVAHALVHALFKTDDAYLSEQQIMAKQALEELYNYSKANDAVTSYSNQSIVEWLAESFSNVEQQIMLRDLDTQGLTFMYKLRNAWDAFTNYLRDIFAMSPISKNNPTQQVEHNGLSDIVSAVHLYSRPSRAKTATGEPVATPQGRRRKTYDNGQLVLIQDTHDLFMNRDAVGSIRAISPVRYELVMYRGDHRTRMRGTMDELIEHVTSFSVGTSQRYRLSDTIYRGLPDDVILPFAHGVPSIGAQMLSTSLLPKVIRNSIAKYIDSLVAQARTKHSNTRKPEYPFMFRAIEAIVSGMLWLRSIPNEAFGMRMFDRLDEIMFENDPTHRILNLDRYAESRRGDASSYASGTNSRLRHAEYQLNRDLKTQGISRNEFDAYITAKHVIERNARHADTPRSGMRNGSDTTGFQYNGKYGSDGAHALVNTFDARKQAQMDGVWKAVHFLNQEMLSQEYKAQLISASEYATLSSYEFYVPLLNLERDAPQVGQATGVKGYSKQGAQLNRFSQPANGVASLFEALDYRNKSVMRNLTMLALRESLLNNLSHGIAKVDAHKIKTVYNPSTGEFDLSDVTESMRNTAHAIVMTRNGVEVIAPNQSTPQGVQLARMFHAMNTPYNPNLLVRMLRQMAVLTSMLNTTLSLAFAPVTAMWSLVSPIATMQWASGLAPKDALQITARMYVNFLKLVVDPQSSVLLTQQGIEGGSNKIMSYYLRQGGGIQGFASGGLDVDRGRVNTKRMSDIWGRRHADDAFANAKSMGDFFRDDKGLLRDAVSHAWQSTLRSMAEISNSVDGTVRFASWLSYIEQHGTAEMRDAITKNDIERLDNLLHAHPSIRDHANSLSKRVTGNFQRKNIFRTVTSIFAFFNAGVQGADMTLGILRTTQGLLVVGALLALGALTTVSAVDDEDDLASDGGSQHLKDRATYQALKINVAGIEFLIQIPYELRPAWVLGVETSALMTGKHSVSDAMLRIGKSVSDAFIPVQPAESDNSTYNALAMVSPTGIRNTITPLVFGGTQYDDNISDDKVYFDEDGKPITNKHILTERKAGKYDWSSTVSSWLNGVVAPDRIEASASGTLGSIYRMGEAYNERGGEGVASWALSRVANRPNQMQAIRSEFYDALREYDLLSQRKDLSKDELSMVNRNKKTLDDALNASRKIKSRGGHQYGAIINGIRTAKDDDAKKKWLDQRDDLQYRQMRIQGLALQSARSVKNRFESDTLQSGEVALEVMRQRDAINVLYSDPTFKDELIRRTK